MRVRRSVLFLILGLAALMPLSPAQGQFPDTSDSPYESSIEALYEAGVIQGYPDGSFQPEKAVNRAELLKMVFVALGESSEDASFCFPDVSEEWFASYVCTAKERGIVQGYPDGSYQPAQEVNMVEAMKVILEAFPMEVREEEGTWYVPYREYFHDNAILSKYSYDPSRSASREEIAYLIHQAMRLESGELEEDFERVPRSSGCGLSPGTAPSQFVVNGETRSAITYVPSNYNPNQSYDLIVAFHGRTNSNADVQRYYGLEKPTAGEAIIVYPAGKYSNGSYTWSDGGDAPGELRDFEFFDVIVEEISSQYCINTYEIYAVGHSLGAWFSNSLACARGDVLKGVATLGGARTESVCSAPVAVMQWHNPNDEHAPFYTALTARDYYLEQNNCSGYAEDVEPYWGNCAQYEGCWDTAPTVWCPHTQDYADYSGDYYPHNWPKGTGEEMWAFFESIP